MAKQLLSPLPGIFYRRPSPNEAPFKQDGDTVAVGETIGLVEVMKSFFPVEAEIAGVSLCFLVQDGEAVEAGQSIAEMQ